MALKILSSSPLEDTAEAILKGKPSGVTFEKKQDSDRKEYYEANLGKASISLRFYSITVRSVKQRLRDPSKTKYKVYALLSLYNGTHLHSTKTKSFGGAVGESRDSEEKVQIAKQKAIVWAKKQGIDLGNLSFLY